MKTIVTIFLFLFISISCLAQTTLTETITLSIKYLRGQTGYYPNSSFVSSITDENDARTIWGIKPEALYDGCRGEVRVSRENGLKTVVLVREFATREAAEQDMSEMIDAIRKSYPSLLTVKLPQKPGPGLLEEKTFGDETNGTFATVLKIFKRPDAEADKQYRLNIFLQR